jgi:hypothetical protein
MDGDAMGIPAQGQNCGTNRLLELARETHAVFQLHTMYV